MPKKTPEATREKVVAMRKEGASYTEIEGALDLSRPTLCKILNEAGLTKGTRKAPVKPRVAGGVSASTPSGSPSFPVQEGGVEDFMPERKVAPKRNVAQEAGEMECDGCGSEFSFDRGDELPDECPECGQ